MRLFLLAPGLTVGASANAEAFHHAFQDDVSGFLNVVPVSSLVALGPIIPEKDDAAVVYNRADQTYTPAVTEFLEQLASAGARAFPVGLTGDALTPPAAVSDAQSFDVPEALAQRGLPEGSERALGPVFARRIIAALRPTLVPDRLAVFLSYRRADGEAVARAFDHQLRVRAEQPFRDRVDVRVGENAQDVILARLRESDVVIFVDTPRAAESDWVLTELRTALGLQIPVVWVRFGPDEGRPRLAVEPSGAPHLKYPGVPLNAEQVPDGIADAALQCAWAAAQEATLRTFTQIRRLRNLAAQGGIGLREVDRARLIYSVAIPREPFRFPQRPVAHVVQFYAHRPHAHEHDAFGDALRTLGCTPHEIFGPPHDAAVLLAPIPPQPDPAGERGGPPHSPLPEGLYVDSVEEYVSALADHVRRTPGERPARNALIVSGAFPDNPSPEHQQHLADALHALVRLALDRGARVIFGNHPTFRPLILELARRRRPGDARGAVRVYTSAYFPRDGAPPPAADPEIPGGVDTVVVETDPGGRNASLTAMRAKMARDPAAAALVAMGGKGPREGITPGVDEEVELAREAGLPVFLIGAAGGRTAELAAAQRAAGWQPPLNPLTLEQNEQLATSQDFDELALMILTSLGL